MPFWAVLDACVLYPIGLCDVLLHIAQAEVFQPLWSEDILDEVRRNVLKNRPGVAIDRRIATMNEAFPEAAVENYSRLIAVLDNDPKDRHVLAAAIVGHAQVIVTSNTSDFPAAACSPYDVEVQTSDAFLTSCFAMDQVRTVQGVALAAEAKKNPSFSLDDLLDHLSEKANVSLFAAKVRSYVATRQSTEPTFLEDLLYETPRPVANT